MNIQERRDKNIEAMKEEGVDLLLGFHNNGHFIEKPNAGDVVISFQVGGRFGGVAGLAACRPPSRRRCKLKAVCGE
ncbi:MAG: hypothetical protein ACKVQK_26095 [Burkholderiales bacterium]